MAHSTAAVERSSPLRAALGDPLLRESGFLIGITVANSVLGFGFWVLASHAYRAADIGVANATISAVGIAALLSDLGLRTLLIRRLAQATDDAEWSRYVSVALAVCTGTSLVGGVVAWLLIRGSSAGVRDYLAGGWPILVAVLTWASTLTLLLDAISTAEHSARRALSRNVATAAIKAALLGVLAYAFHAASQAILLSAAAATAVTVGWGVAWQLRRLRPHWRVRFEGAGQVMRAARSELGGHYLINIAGLLPGLIIPIEVLTRLGPSQAAFMTLTWLLGSVFFMVSPAVSGALFARGARDPAALPHLVRKARRLIAAVMGPAMLGAVVFGHPVLEVFGTAYANAGYGMLVVLAVSAVPDAITNIELGRLRALGTVWTGAALNAIMAVIAIVLTWLLVRPWGITGAGAAWLIAQSTGVLLLVIRAARARVPKRRGRHARSTR